MRASRLVVATTNQGKLREIRTLVADTGVEVLGLADFPPVAEPEETGTTFEANARLKVLYYERLLSPGMAESTFTVAEDSGLVVDGLDGEPGVHSARFLGPDATYPERFAAIQARLAARPGVTRAARFVCALAVARSGHVVYETTGVVEGEVAETPEGAGGFGYDPIFFYPPYGRTLAAVTMDEKVAVAHRGKAVSAFCAWLRSTD